MGTERNFFNLIKNIYNKPTANILPHGEKLDAFPLIQGTRQECPVSPLYTTLYQKS